MARKISQHTTEAPGSTSDLIGNVGSTTKRFTAQQILSIPITAQGDILFGDSSADTTRLAAPTSGAVLAYSSVSSAPVWAVMDPGELLTQTSAAVTTVVAIPTSGAVLRYSTVDGSVGPGWVVLDPDEILVGTSALAIPTSGAVLVYSTAATSGPVWSKPTSGAVLIASSLGTPAWRALGTSGQVLQSTGGSPAWVDGNTLSGAITTAGTSGQVLQTTAGAATWVASNTLTGTITTAGTSGQVLQTTGGAASWVGSTTVTAATPSSITNISWRLAHNTTQTIVSSGTYTALIFNVERFDSDGVHTTVANTSLVTVQTGGLYSIGANAKFTAGAQDMALRILLNSTTPVAETGVRVGVANANPSMNVGTIVSLSSGDTLIVQVWNEVANSVVVSSAQISPEFWGIKIA